MMSGVRIAELPRRVLNRLVILLLATHHSQNRQENP